jgi:hypothetical protein
MMEYYGSDGYEEDTKRREMITPHKLVLPSAVRQRDKTSLNEGYVLSVQKPQKKHPETSEALEPEEVARVTMKIAVTRSRIIAALHELSDVLAKRNSYNSMGNPIDVDLMRMENGKEPRMHYFSQTSELFFVQGILESHEDYILADGRLTMTLSRPGHNYPTVDLHPTKLIQIEDIDGLSLYEKAIDRMKVLRNDKMPLIADPGRYKLQSKPDHVDQFMDLVSSLNLISYESFADGEEWKRNDEES